MNRNRIEINRNKIHTRLGVRWEIEELKRRLQDREIKKREIGNNRQKQDRS